MATSNFPDNLQVLVVDSSELYLGSIDVAANQEWGHILLHMLKFGPHVGDEQFRLNVYNNEARENKLFSSDTLDVSGVISLEAGSWLGKMRFDFNRQNLNIAATYYITIEPITYTRTADTFYFSAVLDWPLPINTNPALRAGAAMELWSYQ